MADLIAEFVAEHATAATWIAAVAAAIVAIGSGLMARAQPAPFVFAVWVNATEEALQSEFRNQGSLRRIRRSLLVDLAVAVAAGTLLAIATGAAVGWEAGDAFPDEWWIALPWVGVLVGVLDLLENVSFLRVIRVFSRSVAETPATPKVAWLWANLAAVFGAAKMLILVGLGVVIAIFAIRDHTLIWAIVAVSAAVGLAGLGGQAFYAPHKRFRAASKA